MNARTTAFVTAPLALVALAGCSADAEPDQWRGGHDGQAFSPDSTSFSDVNGGHGNGNGNRGGGAPADHRSPSVAAPDEPASEALAADLAYLIEEEKLAHDVYVALGEQYDARVFVNIAGSEAQHQDAVAALLDVYGLDDPRLAATGDFSDSDLQALYDQLVESGSQSWSAAVEVGVFIEETDIADLERFMAGAPDEVNAVLGQLLAGSHNHLAAFQRQA